MQQTQRARGVLIMLLELHNSVQRLLYERGHISPREVDIRFEAPTRERVDGLLRPTINLFLFAVQENMDLRQSDFQATRNSGNGRLERRLLLRRFDLRYMVSILTTNSEDEYLLLWRVLATLVQHPQFPEELLSEALRLLDTPLTTQVSQHDFEERMASAWSALGVPPRPALSYVVTVPLNISQAIEAPSGAHTHHALHPSACGGGCARSRYADRRYRARRVRRAARQRQGRACRQSSHRERDQRGRAFHPARRASRERQTARDRG